MEAIRFDRLARALTAEASRRGIMRGVASAGLSLVVLWSSGAVEAKKRRPKKLERNSFGCVDVGKACRGNSANCCSGICEGKKPKKGKRDSSRCVAHDSGECALEQNACAAPGSTCGPLGVCSQTTGKACFCAMNNGNCAVCQTDADCVALGWGPSAACLTGAGCPQTGGTGCASPGH